MRLSERTLLLLWRTKADLDLDGRIVGHLLALLAGDEAKGTCARIKQ